MDSVQANASEKIGPYHVIRRIATGAQANVFECALDEARFAVKLLHEKSSTVRFEREILLTRLIEHSNVVRLRDAGTHDGHPYFVMDLMAGSLAECLHDLRTDSGRLGDVVSQVLAGLIAIHATGITHRDLKPENILFDRNGVVKIADFGIAGSEAATNQTLREFPLGSPLFMSPEQATGADVDYRSDIYSFGCLLYFIVAGQSPFYSMSLNVITNLHRSKRAPALDSESVNESDGLKQVIARCLEPDRRSRFQTVIDIQDALTNIWPDFAAAASVPDDSLTLTNIIGGSHSSIGVSLPVSSSNAEVLAFDFVRRLLLGDQMKHRVGHLKLSILGSSATGLGTLSVTVAFLPELDFPGSEGVIEVDISENGNVVGHRTVRLPRKRLFSRMPLFHTKARLGMTVIGVVGAVVFMGMISFAFLRSEDSNMRTFDLSVESPWQATGVIIRKGDHLTVMASGIVSYSNGWSIAPDGTSPQTGVHGIAERTAQLGRWVDPTMPFGSLVGRIGNEGSIFFIGERRELIADVDGELFLSINDQISAFHDNEGEWTIRISIDQEPLNQREGAAPVIVLHPDLKTGDLIATWTDNLDFESAWLLFNAKTGQPITTVDPDITETRIAMPAPGYSICAFVRAASENGYRSASPTSCFTSMLVSETLTVSDAIEVPVEPYYVAIRPDETELAIANFSSITFLNAETLEIDRTTRVPVQSPMKITSVTYDRTGEMLFVTAAGSVKGQLFVISTANGGVVDSLEIPGLQPDQVHWLPDSEDLILVSGISGWMTIDLEPFEIVERVDLEEDLTIRAVLSPDGTLLYGQRGDTASQDGVYMFDRKSGEQLGQFTYGDYGGDLLYYSTPDGDRLIVLVGDGAIDQNAYVLAPDDLRLIQKLNIPGFARGTTSIAGTSVIVAQNRDIAEFIPAGGSTVHRLIPESLDEWVVMDSLMLLAGTSVSEGSVVASPTTDRYFVTSITSRQVFVIDESG